jgi:hypothetical protein
LSDGKCLNPLIEATGPLQQGFATGEMGFRAPAAILTGSCPLWVISRHQGISDQCPLYPQKADIVHDGGNVRFVPKADVSSLAIGVREKQIR